MRALQPILFVTTDLVLVEVLDHFSDFPPQMRSAALRAVNDTLTSRDFRILRFGRHMLNDGLKLYGARLDKEWSLTDCTSMVAMQRLGIKQVLTSDHHFEQAGFTILLKK